MSKLVDEARRVIEACGEDERRIILRHLRQLVPRHPLEEKWDTTAEAILTAIERSPDLTQRGIRGILAEATFEEFVVPAIQKTGWKTVVVQGDQSYDCMLQKGDRRVRIQVKLQRKEKGLPKEYSKRKRETLEAPPEKLYVVEVQKTRSGEKKGVPTRPYRFGDFDILAVNLHPATGDWQRFMYSVGGWLIPRKSDQRLIEIFQPVPDTPDKYWTDDVAQCIKWLLSGTKRELYRGTR